MSEAIRLFNHQQYWEAHEALEDLWGEDTHDPARNVYWAIIQLAAVCIHVRDKNLVGAASMLNKAREKFERAASPVVKTPLMNQFLSWDELEEIVQKIPANPALEDFTKLSTFTFKNYSAQLE